MDPRINAIDLRLKSIKEIIAVMSGKGGVGKSLLSSVIALSLARMEYKVGLLDLDFHGPSCNVILGVKGLSFIEDKGIVPPRVYGIKIMSISFYINEEVDYLPLRGSDITNALIELLAITRWGSLDYLIVDMPPGTGDELLDLIRFVKKFKTLIVTIPSRLAIATVGRLIKLLKESRRPILGIIENMRSIETDLVKNFAKEYNINYLGWIPFDPQVEDALGDVDKLVKTLFARKVKEIVIKNLIDSNKIES